MATADHADWAEQYNKGHRDGFQYGKAQRDRDIERALERIRLLPPRNGLVLYEDVRRILLELTEV